MKKLSGIIGCYLLVQFSAGTTMAQGNNYQSLGGSKVLSIGDKVPDIAFTMLNYPRRFAHLSDFKGKLVILDFWATWCESCTGVFPKMDSLQKLYVDKVQILLVNSINTGDKRETIISFLKKWNSARNKELQLPIVVEDAIANELFPHKTVPHYIWVGIDGRLKGITYSQEVTVQNINALLKGDDIKMPVKKDFYGNKPMQDLPENQMIFDDSIPYYSFFKKGRFEGLTRINSIRSVLANPEKSTESSLKTRGYTMRNLPLLEMYQTALHLAWLNLRVYPEYRDEAGKEIMVEVAMTEGDDLGKESLYTYDLVVPPDEEDSIPSYILRDLNHYSGFYGRIEKRKPGLSGEYVTKFILYDKKRFFKNNK